MKSFNEENVVRCIEDVSVLLLYYERDGLNCTYSQSGPHKLRTAKSSNKHFSSARMSFLSFPLIKAARSRDM